MKRIMQVSCIFAMALVFLLSVSVSFAADEIATVSFDKNKIHSECDYHIELIAENGTQYTPTEQERNNKTYYDFTVPVKKADEYYTYKFVPEAANADDYYGSQGKLWVYQDVTLTGYNLSDKGYYTVSKKKDVFIDVPEGAIPRYCLRPLFYRYIDRIYGEKVSTADGFDTYKIKVPEVPNAPISYYEVSMQDKVTWAGFLSNMEKLSDNHYKLTDTLKSDPSQVTHEDQSGFEASILLNGPSSKYIKLKTGESFDIYAHRVWQAINSTTINAYVDPTFRYEVVEGSDCISVDEEGRIIAKAAGVGIVEVTYDALDYVAPGNDKRQLYSACWPERAGIYVINVDGTSSTDIETNINLDEFSTVYYAKSIAGVDTGISSAQYSFKPESKSGKEISVSVGHPSFSDTNPTYTYTWQDYEPSENGVYTVDFVKGKNVVKIATDDAATYQVVAANETDITFENKYREGQSIEEGDTVIIRFTNIATPVPKLAALYNPDPAGHSINYTIDGKEYKTSNSQYGISKDAHIEVKFDDAGEKQLRDGYISGNVIGVNGHNNMRKGGFIDNKYVDDMDNPTIDMGKQCVLPEFSINVEAQGSAEEREKREAGELKSLTIGYNTSYDNLFTKDEELSWVQNYTQQKLTASLVNKKAVNIMVEAKNPDSTITVLYSNTNGLSGSKVVNSGEKTVLTTASESLLASGATAGNDCLITINVDPGEKGYPKTYSINLRPTNGANIKSSVITDFTIAPEEGDFLKDECVFKAQDIIGNNAYNWGDGYIQSLYDYSVELPARVEGIKVATATGSYSQNTVISDENNNTYAIGDVIPIIPGNNKIIVKNTSSNNNFTTSYTFNFHIDELERSKYDAIQELQEYVDAIDKTLYKEAEQEEIDQLLTDGKEAINEAEDEEAVAAALAQAKEKVDAVEKAADIDAAVEQVNEAISALPAPDAITLNDKEAVTNAREMFNSLNETEQKYVTNEVILKLAEAVIDKLDAEDKLAKAEDALKQAEADKKAAEGALKEAEEALAKAEQDAFKALAKVSLKNVKGAKKKITVTWKKADGAKGYEVLISKNKKGTKAAKTYTVKKNAAKKVIKKLKKGTYYVKVRAYKTIQGNTVYGKYSKVKKVKVK